MNISKCVKDLLANGGRWVDAQYKDLMKTPDGGCWVWAPNTPHDETGTMWRTC